MLYLHTQHRFVMQYAHNGPAGSCLAGNGKVIPDGETTGDACSSWCVYLGDDSPATKLTLM